MLTFLTVIMVCMGMAIASAQNTQTMDGRKTLSPGVFKEEVNGLIRYTVNGVSFHMVPVQGGTFMMGRNVGNTYREKDKYDGKEYVIDDKWFDEWSTNKAGYFYTGSSWWFFKHEMPPHRVALSDYMIGECEVTQSLYQAVMGPCYISDASERGPNKAVVEVSWLDAKRFIERLNEMTGEHFRLPTEAEWEFAARGGNKSRGYKFSGSDNVVDVVPLPKHVLEKNGDIASYRCVATKLPNELGIYDMSGNVREWCEDLYGEYDIMGQTNPKHAAKVYTDGYWSDYRVVRGGTVVDYMETFTARVEYRRNWIRNSGDSTIGFRLVMDYDD